MIQKVKKIPLIKTDDWHGLYREKWGGIATDDSVVHPAKFSRALIRHIYEHAISDGWLVAGSRVFDCFGGVALGAFDAMRHGLHWQGVELEERFVELGNENIALWNERYSGKMPAWGTARLVQGDSRKLSEIVSKCAAVVSSPPYAVEALGHKGKGSAIDEAKGLHARMNDNRYGATPGQLTQLKEGDFSAVISSPPYEHDTEPHGDLRPNGKVLRDKQLRGYQAVISSPPFVESLASDNPEKRGGLFKDEKRKNDKTLTATYGTSPGQTGAMKAGDFEAVISSPPFEKGCEGVMRASKFKDPEAFAIAQMSTGHGCSLEAKRAAMERDNERASYGTSADNIGNQSGETFWQASKTILEQCHAVLAPNAKAIFVCKDFVRNKQIVPFCEQWAQLCESVGFRLLHVHRCWLVEHKDAQRRFDGGVDSNDVERKSFFRRLAEKKGSPRIDFETVMCFERI
jgi:hypothetical protein